MDSFLESDIILRALALSGSQRPSKLPDVSGVRIRLNDQGTALASASRMKPVTLEIFSDYV